MEEQASIRTAKTKEDADLVAKMATEIWREHYTPIIGAQQVAYMLDKFQSSGQIYMDMTEDGYTYYMVFSDSAPAGYAGIVVEPGDNRLYLSKLYVKRLYRGQGLSKLLLNTIIETAKKRKCKSIWLNVNKRNATSIAIYKKLGFVITSEMVTDIGNRYVMDDYKMELKLSR